MSEWPLVTFTLLVQKFCWCYLFLLPLYFCWLEKEIGNQRATRTFAPRITDKCYIGMLRIISPNTAYGISVECVFVCLAPHIIIMVKP